MPSSYTANYQLSQWALSDKVSHLDFNEDNAKIDAAIKALDNKADRKADTSALSALQSTVSTLQTTVARKQDAASAVRIAAGTYTGNGAQSRTISLGFTPKAVLVTGPLGQTYHVSGSHNYMTGGLVVTGAPLVFNYSNTVYNILDITTNGFHVYSRTLPGDYHINTNSENVRMNYIAIG